MASARAMLARVQRLERLRQAPLSPIELAYGTIDAFVDATMAEVEAGKLDRVDMPMSFNACGTGTATETGPGGR